MYRYIDLMGTMFLYSMSSTAICLMIILLYKYVYHDTSRIRIHLDDVLIVTVLILITSFRYGVGSDFFRYVTNARTYYNWYSDLHRLFNWSTIQDFGGQIGYPFISVISGYISQNEYAILWVTSVIIYVPLIWYCRKYTKNAFVSFSVYLLFGFWGMSLNVLKQAISMIFFAYAYEKLEEKRYIIFGIFALLTFIFHSSAIIAIAVLVVSKWIKPSKTIFWGAIGIGIFFRLSTPLIVKILSTISALNKYLSYFGGEKSLHTDRTFIWLGALIETLVVCCIIYFALTQIEKLRMERKDTDHLLAIIIFGIPFSIIGISGNLWLANRLAKYFFFFLIPLLSVLLGKDRKKYFIDGKSRRFIWLSLIIWHMMYSVLMLDNSEFVIATYLFQLF